MSIREQKMDCCMEALNYYADRLAGGHTLSEPQRKDYKEMCEILSSMGEDAHEFAEYMLTLID